MNEWLQKYPGTLLISREEGKCRSVCDDGKVGEFWYHTCLVTYVPPDHKSRSEFRVYGSAKSKRDIRKMVAEHIIELFSSKLVLYKHEKLPCDLCHELDSRPVPRQTICVAQNFDNGLQRLNTHCQEQGLVLCKITETQDVLVVTHPLLDDVGFYSSSKGSKMKREAIDRVIEMINPESIAAYVNKFCRLEKKERKNDVAQVLHTANITHVLIEGPQDINRIKSWAKDVDPLIFDTEWDGGTPVILAFCKSTTEVLLARVGKAVEKSVLRALFHNLIQTCALICMDKTMENRALEMWGVSAGTKLVDLGAIISQLFPAFSDKAGLLRFSRWFLEWDISPYQLDFKRMQTQGVTWHDLVKNQSLLNHVTVDCLALLKLYNAVIQFIFTE